MPIDFFEKDLVYKNARVNRINLTKVLAKVESTEGFILNIDLLRSNSSKRSNLKSEKTNFLKETPIFKLASDSVGPKLRITFDLEYLSIDQIKSPSLCLFPNLLQYINFSTSLEKEPAAKVRYKDVRLKYLKPEAKSFAVYCSQKKGHPKSLSLLSLYNQGNPKMPLTVWINKFLESLRLIREDSNFDELVFTFKRLTKEDLKKKHLTRAKWNSFRLIVNSFRTIDFKFSAKQWRFILANTFVNDLGLLSNE